MSEETTTKTEQDNREAEANAETRLDGRAENIFQALHDLLWIADAAFSVAVNAGTDQERNSISELKAACRGVQAPVGKLQALRALAAFTQHPPGVDPFPYKGESGDYWTKKLAVLAEDLSNARIRADKYLARLVDAEEDAGEEKVPEPVALTQAQVDRYVMVKGIACPYCGSRGISQAKPSLSPGTNRQYMSWGCVTCGSKWTAAYVLQGVLPGPHADPAGEWMYEGVRGSVPGGLGR